MTTNNRLTLLMAFLVFLAMQYQTFAQIQTGVWRTPANNTDYHHFTRTGGGAAVYINQVSSDANHPILRLSSGTELPNASANIKFTVENNGNVGIGTLTPQFHLDLLAPAISGPEEIVRIRVSDAPSDYLAFRNATGIANQYIPSVKGFYTSDNRPAIFLGGEITSANDNGNWSVVVFDARASDSFVVNRNLFMWRNYTNNLMVLNPAGNLGIGTTTPSHKLEVNGTVRAKEVKLEATNWPDYVFAESYQLPSLEETGAYIKAHGHLPGFKSAAEYEGEGVNMLELNQKLLEKVEELMLHTIKQQQLIEGQWETNIRQSELIEKQQFELGKLKERVDQLESGPMRDGQ